MDANIYSVESSIQQFFDTLTTATRAECDVMAASLVAISGPNQANIVQFRAARSDLDMANMNIAIQVHSRLVPKCNYHGQIGGEFAQSIYVMDKHDGLSYIQVRDTSPEGNAEFEIRQFQTVGDLARFFAEAWKRPQQVTSVANELRQEPQTDLNRLFQELPNRFTRTSNQVRERLPRIFTLPFVITHGDLNEANILVDGAGNITAVIDWAKSKILPFGISLRGLENVLGYMDGAGWHYHDNAEVLRDEFWRIFGVSVGGIQEDVKENIRIARMAGLFLRYGFEQDGSVRGKVRNTDFALRYADAFCTGGI